MVAIEGCLALRRCTAILTHASGMSVRMVDRLSFAADQLLLMRLEDQELEGLNLLAVTLLLLLQYIFSSVFHSLSIKEASHVQSDKLLDIACACIWKRIPRTLETFTASSHTAWSPSPSTNLWPNLA